MTVTSCVEKLCIRIVVIVEEYLLSHGFCQYSKKLYNAYI